MRECSFSSSLLVLVSCEKLHGITNCAAFVCDAPIDVFETIRIGVKPIQYFGVVHSPVVSDTRKHHRKNDAKPRTQDKPPHTTTETRRVKNDAGASNHQSPTDGPNVVPRHSTVISRIQNNSVPAPTFTLDGIAIKIS
jgi:hypothetical protein